MDDIPGNAWAKNATERVLRELGYPSTHNLMVRFAIHKLFKGL